MIENLLVYKKFYVELKSKLFTYSFSNFKHDFYFDFLFDNQNLQ